MNIYLVTITAYDLTGASVETLRYSTGAGFVTAPGDTPANTYFEPRVQQPALIKRAMFSGTNTLGQSRVSTGDLVLINADGGLDFMEDYSFNGRAIEIWYGPETGTYPTDFEQVLIGTMKDALVGNDVVTIRIKDLQEDLEQPIQTTKYLGNNSLPAGLEGVAGDLKGKPKPLCYGVVKNIAPPLVNTSKLIYQVNDGAVNSVDAVYDRGISLGYTTSEWSTTYTPASGAAFSVIYSPELDLYVLGALGGVIATSPDGTTWTARTSTFGADGILGLAWSAADTIFVAVGETGKVATSPDGITWTSRTGAFGTDRHWRVRYSTDLDLFCAVGQNGKIATSPDGVTWTARTSGVATDLYGIVWGDGLFVATGASAVILTSPDGITWTSRTSPFTAAVQVNGVGYGNGLYVAGGAGASNEYAVSPDAVSWGLVSADIGDCRDFYWHAGTFYVASAAEKMATSTDGYTWKTHTVSMGSVMTSVVATDDTALVAGADIKQATGPGTYASEANLLDDSLAPLPGTFNYYAAGGYVRLGSTPDGLITADVTQGANAAARTAAQIWSAGILTKMGKASGTDWNASDVTALDSANNDVCGLWIGTEELKASAALSRVAQSVGAWWGVDRKGIYRIKRLTDPSGETPDYSFVASDIKSPTSIVPRQAMDQVPTYRTILRYKPNYTIQNTDLAGGVSEARRGVLAQPFAEYVKTDTGVQTAHILAREGIYETLIDDASDAATEGDRLQTLRGTKKNVYAVPLGLDIDTVQIDLGEYVELTLDRFGLDSGQVFAVIGIEPDGLRQTVTIEVWG